MKLSVIDAGYVGFLTALGFAHAGHKTILLEHYSECLSKLKAAYCQSYKSQAQEWISELMSFGIMYAMDSPAKAIPFKDII